jgi:hypothetical protein
VSQYSPDKFICRIADIEIYIQFNYEEQRFYAIVFPVDIFQHENELEVGADDNATANDADATQA